MKKEELVILLKDTILEMPQRIDGIYVCKRLFSGLSSINQEAFGALEKLYNLALYTSILSGDFAVLFHQFLSSDLLYESKYAMAKLYPLMNESFKQLYGFVDAKSGLVKITKDAYWTEVQALVPHMNLEEKLLYDDLEKRLQEKASFNWWRDERSAEVHLDAEGIYKHRCAQDDENKAIKDAMSFYEVLTRTSALTTILLTRMSGTHIKQ